jgi:hypothetical protein
MLQGDQLPAGDAGPRQESYLTDKGLFDIPKMNQALASGGMAHLAPELLKGAETINDSITKHAALEQQAAAQQTILVGDLADGALKLTKMGMPVPDAMDFVVQPALATKRIAPQQYAQIRAQIAQLPPEQQQAALTSFMDAAAKVAPTKTLGKDAAEVDRFGRPVASNVVPEKATEAELDAAAQKLYAKRAGGQPLTPEEQATLSGYEARKAGPKGAPVTPAQLGMYQKQIDAIIPPGDKTNSALRTLTIGRVQNARSIEDAEHAVDEASRQVGQINVAKNTVPYKIEVAVGGQAAKDAAAAKGITPDAIDQMAVKLHDTGEMSGLGQGNAVLRRQIINREAELYPNTRLAANSATYKANASSLKNMTGTLDTLSAFENTAGKNLDQFLALANKIPDTGVPWLNMPVRVLTEKLVGSEHMAAVNAARDVALREIARVTNDPKLSGALTDAARAEVAGLSPKDATLPQIRAVVRVLQQDMANVHTGLSEQIDRINTRLGGAAPAPSAPKNDPLGLFKR